MANVVKGEQLYEGKAKKVYATNDPNLVIVDYKDDATAFNGVKKGTISGKGVINNKMTNYMCSRRRAFRPTSLRRSPTVRPSSRRYPSYRSRLSSET